MLGRGMLHGMMMHGGMLQGAMMGRGMLHGRMMARSMPLAQGRMAGAAAMTAAAGTAPAASAAVPAGFAAALATADSAHGQQLALANGCGGCHALAAGQPSVGPPWQGLAVTAAARVHGQKAADYLYTSITQPNAYIVPGYPPNVMVQTYGQTLAADELAAIVKYLLTLQE